MNNTLGKQKNPPLTEVYEPRAGDLISSVSKPMNMSSGFQFIQQKIRKSRTYYTTLPQNSVPGTDLGEQERNLEI